MASKAKAAKGTLIKIGDGGGSETFTTIGEVTSFSGPGISTDEIEVTSFDSAAVEVISSGLPDYGEVTFDVNWVGSSTQQQQLQTDCAAGTLRNFTVTLADHASSPSSFAFAAIIKQFNGPSAGSAKEAYKASVTLRISGTVTRTYASA